jgi:hypothetical protein
MSAHAESSKLTRSAACKLPSASSRSWCFLDGAWGSRFRCELMPRERTSAQHSSRAYFQILWAAFHRQHIGIRAVADFAGSGRQQQLAEGLCACRLVLCHGLRLFLFPCSFNIARRSYATAQIKLRFIIAHTASSSNRKNPQLSRYAIPQSMFCLPRSALLDKTKKSFTTLAERGMLFMSNYNIAKKLIVHL